MAAIWRPQTQGHETDEFLSLFKKGVRYLEGGVATGFKKVDREAFQTRLLHIKGRRNIRTQQVGGPPNVVCRPAEAGSCLRRKTCVCCVEVCTCWVLRPECPPCKLKLTWDHTIVDCPGTP